MEDRLTAVRLRIERDFAEPRLAFPGVAFRRGAAVDDLVCVSGGHEFAVDGGRGEEELAVEVADRLQDDAMDQVWTPWPALARPDGGVTVLQPRLSPSGIGVWAADAGYSCPIGTLQAIFGRMLA